jgi:hypothetical protein
LVPGEPPVTQTVSHLFQKDTIMKKYLSPALRLLVPPLLLLSFGFILCMHWFLLMADTQVEGVTSAIVPAPVIASIMAYYSVVFGPMTWLIKVFILLMALTMTLQLFIPEIPGYLKWSIFLINTPFIFNGVFRIIPLVDQFILNTDTAEVQSSIVRTVHDAHMFSAYGTAVLIILQLIAMIFLQLRAKTK